MKILISGASGLVGKALAGKLHEDGHTVTRLVRAGGSKSSPGDIFWDPMAATVDAPAMEGFDAVIHLSGASIAETRWTPERKAVLRSSRIASTRVLVDTLSGLKQKPRVFLCASAIGYYGNRGDELLTESSEGGTDFLALLARDWEAEARRAELAGIRTVRLRFGVILSAEGGALPRMLTPVQVWHRRTARQRQTVDVLDRARRRGGNCAFGNRERRIFRPRERRRAKSGAKFRIHSNRGGHPTPPGHFRRAGIRPPHRVGRDGRPSSAVKPARNSRSPARNRL